MANLPFFKFDAAAWLTGKVQLLTPLEKGIFIDLLARIWHENGKLKNTEFLHRQIRCEKVELYEAIKTFVELSIMEENDGVLSVKFLSEQLSERDAYRETRRACGAKGGRPKKVAKDTSLHGKGSESSEKKEIKEKGSGKENTEKKETPPVGGDNSAGTPAQENPPAPNFYPKSVDEVLKMAADPRCGCKISRKQAEKYFLARTAVDWYDVHNRKISAGNVWADMRRWFLGDAEKATAATDDIPAVELGENAFTED